MDSPLPVMRGRYCRRHRLVNSAMWGVDALLTACLPPRARGGGIAAPRRVLISDMAHLGDLVAATSILPVLKGAFPECRIGFLIGSWAQPALQGHPLVDDIHILDHWSANRAPLSRGRKQRRHRETRRQALREVRAAHYDAALDLHWNFPNTLPFLWQARIPIRIGYGSGGFGPLATHRVDFDARPLSVRARHLALVRELPVREGDLAQAAPSLPPVSAADAAVLDRELLAGGLGGGEYVVFHVGAGLDLNAWPTAKWRSLARRLAGDGRCLVFTGAGDRDKALIAEVTAELTGCVSLCDRLPWGGFVAAIARARLLVCVDTAASHIAGAVGTPCAVIVTGRHPYLWHPLGHGHRVLSHAVPCAPCHRGRGCAGMECIRDLEVEQVYQAGRDLLDSDLLDGGRGVHARPWPGGAPAEAADQAPPSPQGTLNPGSGRAE